MQIIQGVFEFLEALQSDPTLVSFVEERLLLVVLVGLAFGFAILLVEIRLPLKYYWNLPAFLLHELLSDFRLARNTPVWGLCSETVSKNIIPLAAVELLDKDSKEVIKVTFSNRLGQYGFNVNPGSFIIRAIKNHYVAPPFYDPENIKLVSTDESFAFVIEVIKDELPKADLMLQHVSVYDSSKGIAKVWHFFKSFSINLGNGLLALSILGSLYGWVIAKTPLYGVLLAVGIVFMFIKVYILEAVGSSTS
ncbi:hypothetical protein GW793_02570 [bacterium]|uniref:Uncharacterized protein n=1 Tax=candidate division WWE3 bacterium CG_4_9_14_3_um_filter_39_7 TaxID=1975080 RepID=A0A2M7X0U2_UNCKA|nr:hypothetical protein [bacterium]PJA39805.1 MAG: hypothetical protein CO179_04425 [candidate division WWE3 bacterium CG_4_9_14_3_um_filter_39_7]